MDANKGETVLSVKLDFSICIYESSESECHLVSHQPPGSICCMYVLASRIFISFVSYYKTFWVLNRFMHGSIYDSYVSKFIWMLVNIDVE